MLADEGSGYWIGRLALVAIMRHADGRGPRTALTPMVLEHLGLSRPDDLVNEVYEGAERRQLVATLGQLVEQARAGGDAVAAEILRQAAIELVSAAASVVSRLGMRGDVFQTFLSGGMFKSIPWLAAEVSARLLEVAPRTSSSLLSAEPAIGAVTLARAEAAGRRAGARLSRFSRVPLVNIQIFDDVRTLSAELATRVRAAVTQKPSLVLGLPTGRTPLPFYQALREGPPADWSQVRTFNLDEFVGVDAVVARQLSRLHAARAVRSRSACPPRTSGS